ncbi:MAG: general secretion pathway protein GspA, partial [Deltaproteobacteria bacterium]|nr:general secretion pathway protein GspA [Deltaproteobacteria bacterium]
MTTPHWLRHFGLNEAPFSKALPDGDLWLPTSKKELVDELVEAVDERKTCALRALRRRVPESGCRLTYCHNATLGRRDFYRQLCLALGLSPKATAAGVFYAISAHIEELGRE